MNVYVDSSALLALFETKDRYHEAAKAEWRRLTDDRASLVTSSLVAVECHSLVQSRLGLEAALDLQTLVLALVRLIWVDEGTYRRGITDVFAAARKDLGLVDCVSFLVMRDHGITHAFTFDKHFAAEGFEVLPPPATTDPCSEPSGTRTSR